jgi:hypothetical protein
LDRHPPPGQVPPPQAAGGAEPTPKEKAKALLDQIHKSIAHCKEHNMELDQVESDMSDVDSCLTDLMKLIKQNPDSFASDALHNCEEARNCADDIYSACKDNVSPEISALNNIESLANKIWK